MNTTPRTVLSIAFLSTALLVAGCSSDTESGSAETSGTPTTDAADPTTTEAATDPAGTTDPAETTEPGEATEPGTSDALVDSGQPVVVQTYTGTYLAPTVEGGVATVDDPAASEVPAGWVFTPVGSDGQGYQLATVALTDGEPTCLALPEGGDPSTDRCEATSPAQVFEVTPLDVPEQVAISSSAGHLGVDPTSGALEVLPTGDQVSSTFTLAAQ